MAGMSKLTGKTVWITGASSGIGEALAYGFAERGARLVLSARREDRLQAVAARCRSSVEVLPLDLARLDTLAPTTQALVERTGGIDIMVHNAGVGQRATVVDTRFEIDQKLIETNYLAPVAITKALLPSMLARRSGQFVVMSSVLGLISAKRRSSYAASKHALHGFFNGLRAELSDEGIRVMMVCPGRVSSEFSLAALEGDGRPHGLVDQKPSQALTSEECARQTLRALEQGKDEVVVAKWEGVAVALSRLSPALLRTALRKAKMT